MKKLSKIVLVIMCSFAFTISAFANEDSRNFSVNGIAYSLDEVETLKSTQTEQAEAYKEKLGACYDFKYSTNVEESEDSFETITVETTAEKDDVVSEKEEEGYSVEVEGKEHETATDEYEFTVFNGLVTNAKLNGNTVLSYIGRTIESILADEKFTNYEDDDIRVVNTVTNNIETVDGSRVFSTELAANAYSRVLSLEQYEANVVQNNTERTAFEIVSNRSLSNLQIRLRATAQAVQNNQNKEILDLTIDSTSDARQVKEEEYTSREEADSALAELRNTGLYESVEVNEVIDENKERATKVEEKVPFDWTNDSLDPYYEDVYTEDEKTGYKYFYNEEVVVEEEVVRTNTYLTNAACQLARTVNYSSGWDSVTCERTGTFEYTLTAIKNAVTRLQGYYDEYEYALKYVVSAYNYKYTGSYIATDYTVSYTGNRGNVIIVRESTDKYYDINGSRKLYNVVTTGEKEDNGSCKTIATTSDEAKTVDTGVRESSYYELLLTTSLSVLFIIVLSRKKLYE